MWHSFYQVFVGARLHVTGGVLKGGRAVEGEASIAGNLLFYFITKFFIVCISCHAVYPILVFIFYIQTNKHPYFLFLFSQYWTLLRGFGWIEMALCPHAQTKVTIMTRF